MGDGRLLVAGGQSNNRPIVPFRGTARDHDVHTFDYRTETWEKHRDLHAARYYPTCTTLPNGWAAISSGAANRYPNEFPGGGIFGGRSAGLNRELEGFNPWTETLTKVRFEPRELRSITKPFINRMYPFVHVLPGGTAGTLWVLCNREARLWDIATGSWLPNRFVTHRGLNRNYPNQGAHVMLPLSPYNGHRPRILLVGGQESRNNLATNTAVIFDADLQNVGQSRWRDPKGGHMKHRRFMSDATLMADGTVLVTGGAGHGTADHSHSAVLESEIFDPTTETWRPAAKLHNARMYHSSAVLLPSGRVLIAGNTEHWNPSNEVEDTTVEVYYPPYLFRGRRPSLVNTPTAIDYGTEVILGTLEADLIQRVGLVRCSSVTHTNNMDQRYVELAIQGRGDETLTVAAPPGPTVAPPGPYMVFLIDADGVPSEAEFTGLQFPIPDRPARPLPAHVYFLDDVVEVTLDPEREQEIHLRVRNTSPRAARIQSLQIAGAASPHLTVDKADIPPGDSSIRLRATLPTIVDDPGPIDRAVPYTTQCGATLVTDVSRREDESVAVVIHVRLPDQDPRLTLTPNPTDGSTVTFRNGRDTAVTPSKVVMSPPVGPSAPGMPPPPGITLEFIAGTQDQPIDGNSERELLEVPGGAWPVAGGPRGGWTPQFIQQYTIVLADGTLVRGCVRSG